MKKSSKLLKAEILRIIYKTYIDKYFGTELKSIGIYQSCLQFEGFYNAGSKCYLRYIKEQGLDKYFTIYKLGKRYNLMYKKELDDTLLGFLRINNLLNHLHPKFTMTLI